MARVPDDDQTLLDSRFGAGKSAQEFRDMGLPDRPRRRPKLIWAMGLLALGITLIAKFSSDASGEAQEYKQVEIVSRLQEHCQAGQWHEALDTLSQLPADHPLHASVPHLKCLEKAGAECALRQWEKAYEVLATFPRQESYVAGLTEAVESFRRKISQEVQSKEWLANCPDELSALTQLLTRLDRASVYHPEVAARVESLRQALQSDLESQLEMAIEGDDFAMADKALASWAAQLPGEEASAWTRSVNEARKGHILLQRIERDILSGQFIRAMSLMSDDVPDSERAEAAIQSLKHWLEESSEKQGLLSQASTCLAQGELEKVSGHLEPLGAENAVAALFITRAIDLMGHRKAMDAGLEAGKDGRPEALRHARALLLLTIPGEFHERIQKLEAELSADLAQWSREQEALLREAWDKGDFLAAYTLTEKLLSLGGAPEWVAGHRALLEKAGLRLVDEIYVLLSLDRNLAHDRFRLLESCLPADHPLVLEARAILDRP